MFWTHSLLPEGKGINSSSAELEESFMILAALLLLLLMSISAVNERLLLLNFFLDLTGYCSLPVCSRAVSIHPSTPTVTHLSLLSRYSCWQAFFIRLLELMLRWGRFWCASPCTWSHDDLFHFLHIDAEVCSAPSLAIFYLWPALYLIITGNQSHYCCVICTHDSVGARDCGWAGII